MNTNENCLVCDTAIGDEGTVLSSRSTGDICFCAECWDLIFNAVYEQLKSYGSIMEDQDE